MRMIDPILAELEQEAATTRRYLEAVPEDKMDWKPHEKSMSLAQLAMHLAIIPGGISEFLTQDEIQVPETFHQEPAKSKADLLPALEEGMAKAREILQGMDDEKAQSVWKAMKGRQEVMALPKIALARGILLNHWYHHRGQMSVYLRMLGVPVPATYGPSADENPFGM